MVKLATAGQNAGNRILDEMEMMHMRLINNGKICAVNAKEQRRQEKWKKQQERKRKGGKKNG